MPTYSCNDTSTTEIYTLSLHDALPISIPCVAIFSATMTPWGATIFGMIVRNQPWEQFRKRSEEHTSELQSLTNLVCRLLLEKKKREIARSIRAYSDPANARPRHDSRIA